MKILVAEDEPPVAHAICRELERQGHSVTIAKDGQEAITKLKASDYDYALIDLMMPYVDGFEVAKWIRSDPTKCAMKVAFMTAMANQVDAAQREALGVDRLIAKPIDLASLFPE